MKNYILSFFVLAGSMLVFCAAGHAQDLNFSSRFMFEPAMITQPPNITHPDVGFPDAARKNGVEGVAKVSLILGADGKVRDAKIIQDLPFGVGEAVKKAVESLRFTPASFNGKPVDMPATLVYEVTAFYDEYDKDVSKAKVEGKPMAEYPSQFKSQGMKGEVHVAIAFYADGKVKPLKVESTMPPEFDEAAKKAAEGLKFQPAVHKKSKKPVNQTVWVTFKFSP